MLSFPNAARVDGQRPVKGNLIVKDGHIGIGVVSPKKGSVGLGKGSTVRVSSGVISKSRAGKAMAFGVLALAAKRTQNASYVSIPLTDGTEAVYEVQGVVGAVLAGKLLRELSPLGVNVVTE